VDLQNENSYLSNSDDSSDPFENNQDKSFDPTSASEEEIQVVLDKLNKSLNPEQKRSAETTEGPLMIVAGAGTGKTKTVIHRVASLLVKGVPATNIMVVTFTNKAATEIKTRLEEMIGENGQYVHAGTFHSIIFREILKTNAGSKYLFDQNINMFECAILDDKEYKSLLKDAISELPEQDLLHIAENEWKLSDFESVMSHYRALGYDVYDFAATIVPGSKDEVKDRIIAAAWKKYGEKCREVNGIDFDDILIHASKMLIKEPDIAEELSMKFKYIMLDEYQDTNPVQMAIMDSIAKYHRNICTVGDEKQSIYGFRGSDITIILSFKERYLNAVLVDMNKNYRSYGNIITYFNALADAMGQKLSDGQLAPLRKIDETSEVIKSRRSNSVAMVEFANEDSEADAVINAVARDLRSGVKGDKIAILYRNRKLKEKLEKKFVDNNIAYKINGDSSFFQKSEVRDSIAMIRFIFNPWDSVAGFRLLKATTMKVSDKLAKKAMQEDGLNAHEFLIKKSKEKLKSKKKGESEPGPTRTAQLVSPFVTIAKLIKESVEYGDSPIFVRDALAELWDIYLRPSLEGKSSRANESDHVTDMKIENVQHVFKRVKESLENGMVVQEIIEDLSMMVENNGAQEEDASNKVQFMTVHASKGLEFENVYVIGLDNVTTHGEEPSYDDIEESRRLLYVAMTRAEKKLSMSYSIDRMHNGKYINPTGSPFIKEIEDRIGVKRISMVKRMEHSPSIAMG